MNDAGTPEIITRDTSGITIAWPDGMRSRFHNIWLRDNCRCAHCGTPETGRRRSRLSGMALDITAVDGAMSRDGTLSIRWSDDHRSTFASDWLRAHAYDTAPADGFNPRLWDDTVRAAAPSRDFAEVDGDPAAFLDMLRCVRDYGLCLLHGAPAEGGKLEPFALKIGPLQESNFGRVQDLVIDATKQSVANRTVALKPHTDEPYRASPPGIVLFHCIETDATGGGTSLFMDGFELASRVRAEDPAGFAALARHPQRFRRHFADDVDLQAAFPVIALGPGGDIAGVRINDRVAAPLAIPPDDVEVYYRGLHRLLRLAEDESLMLRRTLRPGDVAIFDNHRILHGRSELTLNGRRWLQWLGVDRGDLFSRLRILPDRLGQPRGADSHARGAYG